MLDEKNHKTASPKNLGATWHTFLRILFGSWRNRCIILAIIGSGSYCAFFLPPRSVAFSYAGQTCHLQPTILPTFERSSGSKDFTVSYARVFRLGSHKLAALKVCFSPAVAPKPGIVRLAVGPDMPFFRIAYRIHIAKPPHIVNAIGIQPIAITKPLRLAINEPDATYAYYIEAQQQTQRCSITATVIMCKLDKLGLTQGMTYDIELARKFNNQDVDAVAKASVNIVPPVTVTATSISQDAIVYDRPKSITVTTDKPIVNVGAKLLLSGKTTGEVALHSAAVGTTVTLSWDEDLAREQTYNLQLTQLDATDGSTLVAPYTLSFTTSGGPKVIGSTITAEGVNPNARIVVTYDQPLATDFDITKYASITGGTAVISRQGDTQVIFALQNLPFCAAFTVQLAAGVPGQNGLVSKDAWSYTSRVNCRAATSVIGYSVQGRPITAYYYGTGSTTILFMGGIHGSEPSGTYLMQDWVSYLDHNAYKIPADRRVVVVPSLNPDGIAHNDRYNANGVNLDRNFPSSDWQTDISIVGGVKPGGGGPAPLSEPETQAIASLTTSLRPRLVMSYHASGSLVGINKVADSAAIGDVYAPAVGYTTMYDTAEEIMGYSFSGEYETWVGEALGAPAVLIELPTVSGHYFAKHLEALWKMVNI